MTELTPTMQIANNATSVLAGAINTTVTSLQVAAGTGALFPQVTTASGQYFCLTLIQAAAPTNFEIVHVTNVSGDTFTIVRHQEGTSALSFIANDLAQNLITAGFLLGMIQIPQDAANATAARYALGIARTVTQLITPLTGGAGNQVAISTTVNVPTGGSNSEILINASIIQAFTTSGPWTWSIGLKVDGGSLESVVSGTMATTAPTTFLVLLPLSAGAHTIQLIWNGDANMTTTNYFMSIQGAE